MAAQCRRSPRGRDPRPDLTPRRAPRRKEAMRVGLVSDTHGLHEPRLDLLFAGCDLILHAGDIVRPAVLEALAKLAPVTAVRGNNDVDPAFGHLPELAQLELGELRVVLVHDVGGRGRLHAPVRRALLATGAHLLVHGHSHRPSAVVEGGTAFVNPGSAGPRRFSLPRSAGLLEMAGSHAEVRLFDLGHPRLPLLQAPLTFEVAARPARATRSPEVVMQIPRIAVRDVAARLARGEAVAFVDARSASSYQSASEQLPGSVRIPPDADVAHLASRLPRAGVIVAYCT
jgi:putative phosphoesterase